MSNVSGPYKLITPEAEWSAFERLPPAFRHWLNHEALNKVSSTQILAALPVALRNGYSLEEILEIFREADRKHSIKSQVFWSPGDIVWGKPIQRRLPTTYGDWNKEPSTHL